MSLRIDALKQWKCESRNVLTDLWQDVPGANGQVSARHGAGNRISDHVSNDMSTVPRPRGPVRAEDRSVRAVVFFVE